MWGAHMGKLMELFRRGPATPPVEVPDQLLADAEACLSRGQDVGGCTAGIGKTIRVTQRRSGEPAPWTARVQ